MLWVQAYYASGKPIFKDLSCTSTLSQHPHLTLSSRRAWMTPGCKWGWPTDFIWLGDKPRPGEDEGTGGESGELGNSFFLTGPSPLQVDRGGRSLPFPCNEGQLPVPSTRGRGATGALMSGIYALPKL